MRDAIFIGPIDGQIRLKRKKVYTTGWIKIKIYSDRTCHGALILCKFSPIAGMAVTIKKVFSMVISETACSGVILAGGLNTRFSGTNKAFLGIGGKRILDSVYDLFSSVFDEVLIVTNQPEDYLEWNANIVSDIFQVRSSLTGIHAGLFYARHPFVFVTACDTPFLKKEIVETLIQAIAPDTAVVIPETAAGMEPLCAVYAKTCLALVERQIQAKKFKIQSMFKKIRVKKIPEATLREKDPELVSFFNINTETDFLTAGQRVKANPTA
jgi:molybdenum cofactor guanylyltransferase